MQKRSRNDMTHSGALASSCAKTLRPSVEARVAAAALRLQQAGELDAVEALLKLVAGDGDAAASAAKPKKPSGLRARQRANASQPRRGAHYERYDEVVIRSKREIRAVLPPQEVKMGAIKSFAAGLMTADELRRVLSTSESQRPPKGDTAFHARRARGERLDDVGPPPTADG
jgi:hypothetical protein